MIRNLMAAMAIPEVRKRIQYVFMMFAVFVLGLILIGGGFAVWMVPAIVLADRVGTPMPPVYFAVYRIAMDTGMIVGPLALGAAADVAGDRLAVGGAGFVLLAGAVLLAAGRR